MGQTKFIYLRLVCGFILVVMLICMGCTVISEPDKSSLSTDQKRNFANNVAMSDNRADYDNDEQFANFRALKGGNLKDNYIFRGASPYLNNERTYYVNGFLENNDIKHFISLSDNSKEINDYLKNENVANFYFGKNYMSRWIFDDALDYESIDINNAEHVKKIISSFRNIINSNGNIYIHCAIGRDRTGIYCEIIEALAGASYKEIVQDYMKSFENYSFITKEETPDIYTKVKHDGVDTFLHTLTNTSEDYPLQTLNFKSYAFDLLLNNNMSEDEINKLIKKICV